MWQTSVISRMYDLYNYYNDDWQIRSQYLVGKDRAWFFFIKKNLDNLEKLDDRVLYCFERGYYPPREGKKND